MMRAATGARPARRARWPFVAALLTVTVWGGVNVWQRTTRETIVLATTSCPFRGQPRVVLSPDLAPADTQPVRIHEETHAAQCRTLGPVRYRLQNLFPRGKLLLEAPAYCAAAAARLGAGFDSSRVSQRLIADMTEAMQEIADSARVVAALRASCPAIIAIHRRSD